MLNPKRLPSERNEPEESPSLSRWIFGFHYVPIRIITLGVLSLARASWAFAVIFALSLSSTLRAEGESQQESLKIATGKASFGALLQGWFVNDSTAPRTGFRLRRAELGFKGSVIENTRWFVMVDAAKSLKTGAVAATNDNKILQDLGVAINLSPELEVMIGQFKTPTTFEGLASTGESPLPERSLSGRSFGDRREPGLMLTYKAGVVRGQAMLSNGQGTNIDDTNDAKDLHLRFELTPWSNLLVGAFGTLGDFTFEQKGRVGANVKYSPLDSLSLRAEVVRARDAGTTSSTGWMVDASYQIMEKLQAVGRFDGISTEGTFTGHATTCGLNYLFFKHHARATLAYAYLSNMTGGLGSYTLQENTGGHLFWVALQSAM